MPLELANNVRYSLSIDGQEPVEIPDPINEDEGNGYIYERDEKSKGVLSTKTNEVEYHGEGFNKLSGIFATEGIVPDVREIKEIKDPDRMDERWTPISETYIDTSDMQTDRVRGVVTTKSVEGGLKREIDDFWSEEYDLTKETSEEEIDIGKPDTINVNLLPREIFLKSRLETDGEVEVSAVVSGGDNLNARTIPMIVDYNSDDINVRGVYGDQLNAASGFYVNLQEEKQANTFYFESDRDREIFLNGTVRVTQSGTPHSGTFRLDLIKYTNGDAYDFGGVVQAMGTANPAVFGDAIEYTFTNYAIMINEGDSLAIATLSDTSDGIRFKATGYLEIEEDSISDPSLTKAFLPSQLFERIIANATGKKGRFKSNLFTTGKWKHLAVAPVYWIRQFPDIINEGTDEERRIQAKTNLSDAYDSYCAIEPLAWWVERVGNIEVMRIELLSYTHQNFIGVHYGTTSEGLVNYLEVQGLKDKTLPNNFYKTIHLGAEKGGGEFEEVQGLRSVGGKARFKTINKKGAKDYEKLSKYTMSAESIEIPRRRPYDKFPDLDTRYDNDWAFLDLIYENGAFRLRTWQDDFEIAPKNVYRPDSLGNLRLTPAQLLINHGFAIKTGLYHNKYAFRNIRWISSDCNSSLITKKAGEDEIDEQGLINHSRLDNPTVIPIIDEFELEVTIDIERQLTGTTLIDGEEVPNWFGLIAYQKEGRVSYGRLVKVDTNKNGSHELIQAYNR